MGNYLFLNVLDTPGGLESIDCLMGFSQVLLVQRVMLFPKGFLLVKAVNLQWCRQGTQLQWVLLLGEVLRSERRLHPQDIQPEEINFFHGKSFSWIFFHGKSFIFFHGKSLSFHSSMAFGCDFDCFLALAGGIFDLVPEFEEDLLKA